MTFEIVWQDSLFVSVEIFELSDRKIFPICVHLSEEFLSDKSFAWKVTTTTKKSLHQDRSVHRWYKLEHILDVDTQLFYLSLFDLC